MEVTHGIERHVRVCDSGFKGKFHGNAEERDGKLYFKGTVSTEAEKNEIWNAIKTIPTWQKDVVADIQVRRSGWVRAQVRHPQRDAHQLRAKPTR